MERSIIKVTFNWEVTSVMGFPLDYSDQSLGQLWYPLVPERLAFHAKKNKRKIHERGQSKSEIWYLLFLHLSLQCRHPQFQAEVRTNAWILPLRKQVLGQTSLDTETWHNKKMDLHEWFVEKQTRKKTCRNEDKKNWKSCSLDVCT